MGENQLLLHRVRIKGDLDLEAQRIGLRLIFDQCEFDQGLNLCGARAIDIGLLGCTLRGPLLGIQLNVERNLRLDDLSGGDVVMLTLAKIGGQLSLRGVALTATSDDGENTLSSLDADGIEVGGNVVAEKLTVDGELRLRGAKVDGQISMREARLGRIATGGSGVNAALFADGMRVAQGLYCDGMTSIGGFRIPGATIGRQISATGARIEGATSEAGSREVALFADRASVEGSAFFDELRAHGEVRFLNAEIDGILSMDGAKLDSDHEDGDGAPRAFSADGMRVGSDVFCRDGFSTKGEMRLLGADIAGSLWMDGAQLEAGGGSGTSALSVDRVRIAEGMLCKGLSAKGEIRLHGANIGGFLAMDGATFEGNERQDGAFDPAFNASRATIGGSVHCAEVSMTGELRLIGAKIGGQLGLLGARLVNRPDRTCLNLIAANIDELLFALTEGVGTADLRDASVRSLWDAEGGRFGGNLPERLRLEGFSYASLREPLDAAQRLGWIGRSQQGRHYPEVYTELANAFRRSGRMGEARAVLIANERRARRDCPRGSHRRLWHDVLWVTIGYGYRNWLAAIWLIGLIGVGALVFSLDQDSFSAAARNPPAFNPFLYAADVTIPVLDLGQSRAWSASGYLAWMGLVLAVSGYALAAAVIAAAAGLLSRDQS